MEHLTVNSVCALTVPSPVQMFTHLISHHPVKSVQMIPVESRQCVCFYLLRSSGGHCGLGGGEGAEIRELCGWKA